MGWHFNPYALVLFICAQATIWVAVYAWRRRALVGAWPALTLLGITIWSLGYAVAIGVHDLTWRIFWAKVQHLGIALTPVAMAAFVFRYIGREEWLTRRNLALLAAVPLVGLLLTWTNEVHHLIWARTELRIVGSLALLDISYGPYFWFYFAYNYLILLFGAVVFLRVALRSSHLQRRQATIMLIGTLFPGIALLIYLAGLSPLPDLDLAPFGYSLGSLVLVWGLFRYRLFDIVPVARDTLVERLGDGVLVLDAQDRIVDINPAAQRLIGASISPVGQRAEVALAAWPDWVARYHDISEAQTEVRLEDPARCLDLRISPLHDRRGHSTGRLIVLRDITKHRLADEALRQSNAELQARNEELDAFAHTVAHDLKNSLNGIGGYAQVLTDDYATLPKELVQESLNTIAQISAKMDNILDELMLLAGLRKQAVESTPLDMADIVAAAQERLKPLIKARRAEISIPQGWPVALGHAPWVEEVWVNYISNAIQYGGQPPCAELGATVQPDGKVCFWIRDNGLGLTQEEQARLFTPFTRLDQVRAKGHGLGLSIVRRIVERMNGQVGVESHVGQGSTFTFMLPRETS